MYLNTHTYFSLRYGTLSPGELVEVARKHGVKNLVLTDINNTSCSYSFVKSCKAVGINPILGIEFRQDGELLYVGIAKNKRGFYELNQLLTNCSLDGKPLPAIAPNFKNAFIIYTKESKPIARFKAHEFLGIRPEAVNGLYSSPLKHHQDKLAVFSPVTFLDHEGFRTHK